jgi:DNA invertase Pin-like site-specific DNA recombinase
MPGSTEKVEQRRGVAYSYVRFSTSKQELGDSLRRQVQMAEDYCAKAGLDLHPVSYRDLGVSAFKRKNIERGALSAFIEAVRIGKVARGSYLVIEQFDRLSRADTNKALSLLLNLVEAGLLELASVCGWRQSQRFLQQMGRTLFASSAKTQ